MRIVGGQHRGIQLADVGKGDAKAQLRPTSDRVRENIFNILTAGRFGDVISDSHVLDLFAGTGALGLEALSRGARDVTFVENGEVGQKLITANIAKLRRRDDCKLIASDVADLPKTTVASDLVFLDPPYGRNLGAKALLSLRQIGWIAKGAVIVWEEASAQIAPKGFELLDHRRYGDTWITLLKAV